MLAGAADVYRLRASLELFCQDSNEAVDHLAAADRGELLRAYNNSQCGVICTRRGDSHVDNDTS